MTWWTVFAPLVHALRGEAAPARSRDRSGSALPFEADWGDVLVRLGIPLSALREVVEADSLHPHFHYRDYTKPKKGGGLREINEPDVKLKLVQQEILTRYLAAAPNPAA